LPEEPQEEVAPAEVMAVAERDAGENMEEAAVASSGQGRAVVSLTVVGADRERAAVEL
jgi:hypothetical protein